MLLVVGGASETYTIVARGRSFLVFHNIFLPNC